MSKGAAFDPATWRDGSAGFFKFLEDVQPRVRDGRGGFVPYMPAGEVREAIAKALDGDYSCVVFCFPRRHGKTVAAIMIALWRFITRNSESTRANQWASAAINHISLHLDAVDDWDDQVAGRSGATSLKDVDGNRIGTLLSNETLRNRGQIASQLGAHSTGEDPSLGEFFRGIANMKTPQHVRNALSEGTNTAGGYTVPTVLLPGILNALVPASSLLNAGVSIGYLDTQQASSFNIPGIATIPTPGWRSEAGAIAESDPAFRSIAVTPRSLAFRFKVSRELLADSPDIDDALQTVVAAAFAKEIDRAGQTNPIRHVGSIS